MSNDATQPAAEPATPSTEDRLASALDRLGERLERLEAQPKGPVHEVPRNEARPGARPQAATPRTQRELARLSVDNPAEYRRLMADDLFDPTTLRAE